LLPLFEALVDRHPVDCLSALCKIGDGPEKPPVTFDAEIIRANRFAGLLVGEMARQQAAEDQLLGLKAGRERSILHARPSSAVNPAGTSRRSIRTAAQTSRGLRSRIA
jgi:hypothetical protein